MLVVTYDKKPNAIFTNNICGNHKDRDIEAESRFYSQFIDKLVIDDAIWDVGCGEYPNSSKKIFDQASLQGKPVEVYAIDPRLAWNSQMDGVNIVRNFMDPIANPLLTGIYLGLDERLVGRKFTEKAASYGIALDARVIGIWSCTESNPDMSSIERLLENYGYDLTNISDRMLLAEKNQ